MMTGEQLLDRIAGKHGLTLNDLLSRTRTKRVTDARHEFFFCALTETKASSVEIGAVCGKDHTTVLYGAAAHAIRNGLAVPRGASDGWRKKASRERAAA